MQRACFGQVLFGQFFRNWIPKAVRRRVLCWSRREVCNLQLVVFLFFVQGRRIFRPGDRKHTATEVLYWVVSWTQGLVVHVPPTFSDLIFVFLCFSLGYWEYHQPSNTFSKDRMPDWLYFHWSARRSSDASCPASCPACLDISQGLKAWPPVCKASVIPIELKTHLLKKGTSCLHYVRTLWKLVTLEARDQ